MLKSINTKYELLNKSKKHPNNPHFARQYKEYRNNLNKILDEAYIKYYKSKMDKDTEKPDKLWKNVKNILNKNQTKKNTFCEIRKEDQIISKKSDIAECFNKYFSSVGKTMAEKITSNNNLIYPTPINVHSIFLTPTNTNEVIQTIISLKNGKTPGIDGIKSETFKELKDFISPPLAHIINTCFETGTFPKTQKKAIIK